MTLEERFEEAKKQAPERCLWAWRYAEQGHGLLGKQAHSVGVKPPVDTILGVAGWTFCGRHTVRVLTLNEAKAVEEKALELPGLSWHLYENEPADALPATEEVEQLKAALLRPPDDGIFTLNHVAMYGRAKTATCGGCVVNCDLAMERGHVKYSVRLGEGIITLHRDARDTFHRSPVPQREWWDPKTGLLQWWTESS